MQAEDLFRYAAGVKVVAVETVHCADVYPPFIFVRVHTDAGLVGLGQTADTRTAPVVHDLARRFLLGRDPLEIDAFWSTAFDFAAYHGYAGAELRAISALDVALWDVLGQVAGQPIYALLGGAVRERLRIYNTCSSYGDRSDGRMALEEPQRLVDELLAAGITCLKFTPWDRYARANKGEPLTLEQLREGLAAHAALHRAGQGRMEVMIDMHGLWNLADAVQIAQSLEASNLPIHWLEDPLWQDNPQSWADLRSKTKLRIAGSERLFTRWGMRPLLEAGGTDVWISDVTWTGGISEFKRMATMAETYRVPVAAHDHSGPVNLYASAHVLLNAPNAYMMETARVFYETYYDELIEGEPILRDGAIHRPHGPGLDIRLRPSVFERTDVTVERSAV